MFRKMHTNKEISAYLQSAGKFGQYIYRVGDIFDTNNFRFE